MYRVVVQFTRDGEATIRPYIEDGPLVGIVEVRTANATLAALEDAHVAARLAVRDLGIPFHSGTNVKGNQVELWVTDPMAFDRALQEANIQLPDHVEAVKAVYTATPAVEAAIEITTEHEHECQ